MRMHKACNLWWVPSNNVAICIKLVFFVIATCDLSKRTEEVKQQMRDKKKPTSNKQPRQPTINWEDAQNAGKTRYRNQRNGNKGQIANWTIHVTCSMREREKSSKKCRKWPKITELVGQTSIFDTKNSEETGWLIYNNGTKVTVTETFDEEYISILLTVYQRASQTRTAHYRTPREKTRNAEVS